MWKAALILAVCGLGARADVSLRNGNMAAPHGSGTPGSVASQTSSAATVAAQQAAQVAANAQAATQHSLQALQAMQAAQAAARASSVASGINNLGFNPNNPSQQLPNVPDGIATGGLMPAGGTTPTQNGATTSYTLPSSWQNVQSLTQTSSGGQVADTVTQSGQQALLYWTTFNVGRNTTLAFDQSAGGANVDQWVAINEIKDPSLSPSQILGSIQAPGQVYVINQNGIIFGGSSQVNVHALVASSLALNPDYITNGLLNNAQNNYEFQFSDLVAETTQVTGTRGHLVTSTTVSPLWTAPSTASGVTQEVFALPAGDVTVQAGAQLTSPTDANHDGGRIALFAPNVVNDGTISTPDGQTILAAGEQVGLTAHANSDPTLRGLDVSIGQVATSSVTLGSQTFTFNGLPGSDYLGANDPGSDQLTLTGTGQVGTYTPPGGTAQPIMGGLATTIPVGSSVTLTSGTESFAAVQAGTATNAANVLDGSGNILVPGGYIEAARADVTLAGASVNQLGIINSSTSVTLNGRIDLLADYGAQAATLNGVTALYPTATGSVTFGGQSVTQILPETSDSETTIGSELALSSLVEVQGLTLEMQPGSLLYAPSANTPGDSSSPAVNLVGATLTAGVNFNAGTWYPLGTTPGAITTVFSYSQGTISLDSNSIIDVSGSENVADSVAQNIVAAQLRGPELADSTLQQNGALRGDTVMVNIEQEGVYDGTPWIGTPLGDVSGYADDIEHTVGQLTVGGGTIALNAGTSVALQSNSEINVSGGYINYAGAYVQTSKVITESGQLIDISQAIPDIVYQGIYQGYTESSPKYDISQTFTSTLLDGAHYEVGYLQGGSGGGISITAPTMSLNGSIFGNTVTGPQQQTPMAALADTYAGAAFLPITEQIAGIPLPSALDLNFFQLAADNVTKVYGASSPDVTFVNEGMAPPGTSGQIYLSQDIVDQDGFGNIDIDTSASGTITVAAGTSLVAPYGGDLVFQAANIDIDGLVATPGQGSMTFTAYDVPRDFDPITNTPAADSSRGQFILAPGAVLSADGLVINNQAGTDARPLALNGGAIAISALDVDLAVGSVVDVSGGAASLSNKAATYGNAGSISILGGQDPQYASLVDTGRLELGSTLLGYSGLVGGGGSLTIQAPLVQIGGSSLLNGDTSGGALASGEPGVISNGTTLWLNAAGGADFFSEGGFSSFDLEGLGRFETDNAGNVLFDTADDPIVSPAVLITSGTIIRPQVGLSQVSMANGQAVLAPLSASAMASLLPSQRSAVNLIFDAEGVTSSFAADGPPLPGGGVYQNINGGGLIIRGDLVLDNDALIETDPQVNSAQGIQLLAGNGTVAVLGSVLAPGGTIVVKGGSTSSLNSNQLLFYESSPTQPFPTVDLGPDSLLSAAGVAEQTFNNLGYDTGTVLNGGQVIVSGNIVGEAGAVIDVSGSSAAFDELSGARGVPSQGLLSPLYAATQVESSGGSITLSASQLLLSDATLLGSAGGPAAQGASLLISSGFTDTINPNNQPSTPIDITLVVGQQGANNGYVLPSNFGTGLDVIEDKANFSPLTTATGEVDSFFAANPNLFVSTAVDGSASDNGGRPGGFDSLSLAGTVDFQGPLRLSLSRSLAVGLSSGSLNTGQTGGVIYAESNTVLSAPYVALNLNQQSILPDVVTAADYPAATTGSGALTIDASVLADVGNISLQDIGTFNLNAGAQAGAIRGDGTLQAAGIINLNATQIYPSTESTFTIEAGTLNITAPAGPLPTLPLSGGGTLNLEAVTIHQGGVLRAPLGVINLGTGNTENIVLEPGSITSVSAVDPTTGQGIIIPYGIISQSGDWYDPDGNDLTVAGNGTDGVPAKAINISGQNVDLESGSTLDLRGGGDLLAYSFTPGTGGNQDILASTTSYAIIPGYSPGYAAVGTYAQNGNLETNGVTDEGYYNGGLLVGEQIYLDGTAGLPAGTYTLLPARYALLPGAYLVTPSSSRLLTTSVAQPDGSSLVAGYLTSSLNPQAAGLYSAFAVDPQSVVLARAPYSVALGNSYFTSSAAAHEIALPRLPEDAGQLVLDAGATMTIDGSLLSQAQGNGLGGEVDIASPGDIYIVGPSEEASVPAGALALDASQLTDFGADSLLIGGDRTHSDTGTAVTVTTDDLVVDDAGASTTVDGEQMQGLAAPDLILVSNGSLTLAANAVVEQAGGSSSGAETLSFGGTAGNEPSGAGDGAILRVSSDPTAQIVRENVDSADLSPQLTVDASASVRNADGGPVGALILDSTAGLTVNTSANLAPSLSGDTLTIDSGLINIELGTPATAPTSGLVINQAELGSLLNSTQSLSLLSYSSIALYGSGAIGGVGSGSTGQTTYQETSLALHANDIYYADTQNSAGITINAGTVTLDNSAGGSTLPVLSGLGTGSLAINAETVSLGSGSVRMDGFSSVNINAASAVVLRGLGSQAAGTDDVPTPASLTVSGALTLATPIITNGAADQTATSSTTTAVDQAITSSGALVMELPSSPYGLSVTPGGLAANLVLTGASVDETGGSIVLPSGSVALVATSGNVNVDGTVNVAGVPQSFFGLDKYTNGGEVTLSSSSGNVALGAGSMIDVSAASGLGTADSQAGSAGSLTISAPSGLFTAVGTLQGGAGEVEDSSGAIIAQGAGGTFSLDADRLAGTDFSAIETLLAPMTTISGAVYAGGFDGAQSVRLRGQSLVIDGPVAAQSINLSVDAGSITVGPAGRLIATAPGTNGIDLATASPNGELVLAHPGATGGTISLAASGSVVLQSGSLLSAAGQGDDDAGQGGSISLAAGSESTVNGTTTIDPSATISVASGATIDLRTLQTGVSFDGSEISGTTGTLNFRAPQILSGGTPTGVQMNPVRGTIVDASSITVEGYAFFQAPGGVIDDEESAVEANGAAFSSAMGTGTAQVSPLFANAVLTGPTPAIDIVPGAEIINANGNLILQNSWNLAASRYGVNNLGQALPGVLTLRAAGNILIDFGASLSDGFTDATDLGVLLPDGSLSYAYNIVSGADLSAADILRVQPVSALQGSGGSLLLGYQDSTSPVTLSQAGTNSIDTFFQTIRTGTGNIAVAAGGNVELLNNLATIYTAGSQVDATLGSTFNAPNGTNSNGVSLPATYSSGGGNVSISAQGDIAHDAYEPGDGAVLIADSSDEMPTNWLDREGSTSAGQVVLPTTWWVDFTNYFEGIGALGGGNVSLLAGGSVINVDADVPTNARLVNGQLTEMGGGDLLVQAGNNIDGGVYYVERGQGTLVAGNDIQTNATRAAVTLGQPSTPIDWLPTTMFLGEGSFTTTAGGNLLLGPVANPFLLPQSYNNIANEQDTTSEIAFFSTYAAQDTVNAMALTGDVTIQDHASTGQGSLAAFYDNLLDAPATNEISLSEPWLRLADASGQTITVVNELNGAKTLPLGAPSDIFGGASSLLPPTFRVTAVQGDINLVGSLTLTPSSLGTLDLVADGSINAFEVNLVSITGNTTTYQSAAAAIDVSDANPASLPTPVSPLTSGQLLVAALDPLFSETGASSGLTLQTEQDLHADINGEPLHAGDTDPVQIYAVNGAISGFNAFTPKETQVIAGTDLSDIGLYIQNVNADDISIVEAGRDILAYDQSSPLRVAAGTGLLGYDSLDEPEGLGAGAPNSGDIQAGGPGTLEVLAGRDVTLGDDASQNVSSSLKDAGLYTGISTTGGAANPALPFAGADLIVASGVGLAGGGSPGLANGSLDFPAFIAAFLNPSSAPSTIYLPDLAAVLGLSGESDAQVWTAFQKLPVAQEDAAALKIFYLVLRDSGRDHNDVTSPNDGNYAAGDEAIADLFPSDEIYGGLIDMTSREVKTNNGGDVEMLAPGGALTVGIEATGTQPLDQGVLTVDGGDISIFANSNVNVGSSRIFTLHGGNEIIWSSTGNIDAGASSKTVVSAPPTRVVVDATSGNVETDLGGLATGGGIGVLASLVGVPPGDVDLIAPEGVVDAGDAGIRATGNLNISAVQVLNASNIQVGGKSTGVPAASSVNLGAITAGSSVAGSSQQASATTGPARSGNPVAAQSLPSIITVEVVGYGGGDTD